MPVISSTSCTCSFLMQHVLIILAPVLEHYIFFRPRINPWTTDLPYYSKPAQVMALLNARSWFANIKPNSSIPFPLPILLLALYMLCLGQTKPLPICFTSSTNLGVLGTRTSLNFSCLVPCSVFVSIADDCKVSRR
jgi:hypothetical protein